ncbi:MULTISPECIES: hypothetical protein [Streptomycetaceae]|uniref:Uncharacterized protein n=1 Tax=Streptantibioticus cattleyicolor (strain ATCC 35852 / DSM 46488 / JCM 4925 / NBRC 14057 / NRRL 8057) TaxID=1003195 RepID=F8JUI6_STREN|nr:MULTISPECIES: hypothetical protein [Streptomycetaceae]AEW95607.1 hypothetical protein SCATT_32360 [Streptantibioticus cattleyicolor NRRL 8057 = DSM 46488]MYS60156.1 hypothetical protein [Streptomyces sp. SID5468]CCB75945.1 protein of unknown function [Streptantibioticus cattleyicolor NRRL 8057 = DSM 46488]
MNGCSTIVGPSYYACRDCRTAHQLISRAESPFTDGLPRARFTDVLPRSRPDYRYAFPPVRRQHIVRGD